LSVQKRTKEIISNTPEDFTIAVEDESIFIHDTLIRKMWTPEGMRPIVITTGSHKKTCVFDQYSFISYLPELKGKFHKLILFLDRAPQHCRSKRVKAFKKNNEVMTVEYLPNGSSEFSAVEECWRQGKDNLLVSKYYPSFTNLKAAITNYYKTKRFILNIVKYLMRESASLC
jgi:transposase